MGCAGSKSGAVIVSRNEASKGDSSLTLPQTGTTSVEKQPPRTAKEIVAAIPQQTKDNVKVSAGMFVTQNTMAMSERYVRLKPLGEGQYGQVWLCRDKITGSERAVKLIAKQGSAKQQAEFRHEVETVKSLDHPNIMKIYEFFEDEQNFYLVMELYSGGELFDEIMKRTYFSEVDAVHVMEQCLSGICYLHSVGVVHRDLKPENLLLSSDRADASIKIVDFGMATMGATKITQARVGTAYYIAPEVIDPEKFGGGSYDEKCDVWSLGVILYILITGTPPFWGDEDDDILNKIVSQNKFVIEPMYEKTLSKEVQDLLKKMLVWEPTKRFTASECLAHPWIKNGSSIGSLHKNDKHAAAALGNMKKFHSNQKLAQAALLFMGSKLTTMEETKELSRVFHKIDTDGNGKLDREELIQGYSIFAKGGAMTKKEIEASVDQILNSIDFDRNGYIEFSEFVTVAMNRVDLLTETRLRAAFQMFDQDGSGAIAAEELRVLLGDVDDSVWTEILAEVDANGDGEVDFEEFETMMMKLIEKATC